jgi:CubicO group peptidase (beta-lactamase class C family)
MDLRFDSNGTYLPLKEQIQAGLDAIWDMASLTKLFTIVAALKQLCKGILGLKITVSHYEPALSVNGKQNIIIYIL